MKLTLSSATAALLLASANGFSVSYLNNLPGSTAAPQKYDPNTPSLVSALETGYSGSTAAPPAESNAAPTSAEYLKSMGGSGPQKYTEAPLKVAAPKPGDYLSAVVSGASASASSYASYSAPAAPAAPAASFAPPAASFAAPAAPAVSYASSTSGTQKYVEPPLKVAAPKPGDFLSNLGGSAAPAASYSAPAASYSAPAAPAASYATSTSGPQKYVEAPLKVAAPKPGDFLSNLGGSAAPAASYSAPAAAAPAASYSAPAASTSAPQKYVEAPLKVAAPKPGDFLSNLGGSAAPAASYSAPAAAAPAASYSAPAAPAASTSAPQKYVAPPLKVAAPKPGDFLSGLGGSAAPAASYSAPAAAAPAASSSPAVGTTAAPTSADYLKSMGGAAPQKYVEAPLKIAAPKPGDYLSAVTSGASASIAPAAATPSTTIAADGSPVHYHTHNHKHNHEHHHHHTHVHNH